MLIRVKTNGLEADNRGGGWEKLFEQSSHYMTVRLKSHIYNRGVQVVSIKPIMAVLS
jgi:hypothetical protein